ncbi:glycoside hydrolase family 31 protein [Marinoscillum furvescens]|uniref:Alpha-D-xyloside xylohydrolase n=1 Tax=Marinoscillum furvescens DSM 4134 TaxID=1122208 RepID=A0A3D9L6K1_MARFU|nr:TIM-barrel domain-containing protein [Marinoscillum furvescens]REE01991.1 alpha-D-xyloside xylohydrolase [Marinoscillum furvescens DSM 4134]
MKPNWKNLCAAVGICMLMALSACGQSYSLKYNKGQNGLTIYHDSLTIELTVMNEAIIHVTKTPQRGTESKLPDYVTVLEPQDVAWEVTESADALTLATSKMKVVVNSAGIIRYADADGNELLAETREQTYIVPGAEGNDVSQAFVAGEEALYGLGQFQSGIMNWKNVPIRLQQYNQEIAIPFLVSTKGYGIYWHNYSLTDINEPQHEIQFATKAEVATGGEEQVVPEGGEKENVAAYASKEAEKKNIRETTFTPEKTGEYTFLALSDNDGRMRGEIIVSIDGDEVINYSTIWMPRRYSGRKYLKGGKTYKVVFQNSGARIPGRLFYNEPDYNKTVFSSAVGSSIDYYFIAGENPGEVIAQNHVLTGQTPLFPKKAYGFWQCRERYHNQAELLENAREMRNREIPVDYIVQDWFYWPKGTKGPEWDRNKYPDAQAMVKEVNDLNMKLMVSVWPEVKNKGLEEKYALTKIPSSNYIDIYDEGVADRFYQMLSDSMFQWGVSSIWLDGTEPEGVKDAKAMTAVGPFEVVHNTYSLEVTRAVYEGRRAEFPEERVFNLTRSAYAGQQRYGATSWSGDTEASWEQLEEQIAAGLNFTMAGVPYWTHDIGGFFRDSKSINNLFDSQYTNPEFIELLTRWFQFGTFSPIFRIHGYVSETEIWRYNEAFENTARKFIDLRYQLMPYIYSQAWQITQNGRQLMAPLAYHYPDDPNTWAVKDQFFFGESLLVGVVTEYQEREKALYLPAGSWYNYWTGEQVSGAQNITVDAPLDETPLFVKAGSIVPFGPKVQYATQKTDAPTTLKIYPGADATFTLYYDDNLSYAYEQGAFSEIALSYDETKKALTIQKGAGDYLDLAQAPMTFEVEMIGGTTKTVDFQGDALTVAFD